MYGEITQEHRQKSTCCNESAGASRSEETPSLEKGRGQDADVAQRDRGEARYFQVAWRRESTRPGSQENRLSVREDHLEDTRRISQAEPREEHRKTWRWTQDAANREPQRHGR